MVKRKRNLGHLTVYGSEWITDWKYWWVSERYKLKQNARSDGPCIIHKNGEKHWRKRI